MLSFFIASFLAVSLCNFLHANLDGTITPIFVDTTYTFTSGESALGFVYFKNGFDLPPGGTVSLDLTQRVDGPITLNGGTLILNNHIYLGEDTTISGSAFIDSQGHTIFFNGTKGITDQLIFIGNVDIDGQGIGRFNIRDSGIFNFEQSTLVEFSDMSFFLSQPSTSFKLSSNGVNTIRFSNVSIDLRRGATLFFTGTNFFIEGVRGLSIAGLGSTLEILSSLRPATKLSIMPDVTLKTKNLLPLFDDAEVLLDRATMDIYDVTTTNRLIFPRGSLDISGECFIKSTANNVIIMGDSADIIFNPGARIVLDDSTHLII